VTPLAEPEVIGNETPSDSNRRPPVVVIRLHARRQKHDQCSRSWASKILMNSHPFLEQLQGIRRLLKDTSECHSPTLCEESDSLKRNP
jgi:hypothetical protein